MFIHKGKKKFEMNPKIILENKSFKVQELTYSIYKTKKNHHPQIIIFIPNIILFLIK
jgi:hypothetical protein